jgi:two-component system response regulator YesN
LSYENAILSLLHLSTYTQDVLNEKNQKKLDSDVYDFTALKKIVFEECSIREFEKQYTEIVLEFMKKIIKKKQSTQNDLLEKVKQYIDENYDNIELCAQSIADKFKLSAKYLSYAFKEYTGMSLLVYLQKKRIDTACELLENTAMTVGEITYKIGIENENYFYTLFKKNVGMTPKQYRQSKITI